VKTMNDINLTKHPHRRFNPLLREWILVSPHRTDRPWQGQMEAVSAPSMQKYDPTCYMCPGNKRSTDAENPDYKKIFVFDNDFPALLSNTPTASSSTNNLLIAETETGICRVLCFSPRHDLTLSQMEAADIRVVVDAWIAQVQELGARKEVGYVQIFENRGVMMGASNPHPHCQIWASASVPNLVATEQESQLAYKNANGSCLLCDYTAIEQEQKERVIFENDHFLVVVPFWAVWPFETMIVSRRHFAAMPDMKNDERDSLSEILQQVTSRYDNLFQSSFPYSMGFHQRPTDDLAHKEWHFHAHLFPPLLRSATVRKFMVGYELLATPQRDITPESAADRLRAATNASWR
jgi:UDPglucose--hexose-1-phosphate uridylyltransferase